ncbi:choice-of-anchor tandem repeat GloVer-containing protein [Rhodanobacter sp. C01]|uniref:choice-of-anchor tandem repeat GloVer-containing protein n=1 Tax=Rhodanobacter sp. C01 TaxID=1945856 RepID=UPI0014388988|nr:choice-of-anchor tandem repeat GloVer-containing protein [Rhodanobacter sp. C01]
MATLLFGGLGNFSHASPARYQVIMQFPNADGLGAAQFGFAIAPSGIMYGTFGSGGGTYAQGGIYSVTPSGVFTDIHDMGLYEGSQQLPGGSRASVPFVQSVGLTSDGSVYGTTYAGGPYTDPVNGPQPQGTVFKLSPDGQFTTLHTFYGNTLSTSDGATPMGVTLGPDGNYYGFTLYGGGTNGSNGGTIFQLTPDGQEKIIYSFYGSGNNATSFLVGSDGNIYGSLLAGSQLTYMGPSLTTDVLFKLTLDGNLSVIHEFDSAADGADVSHLIQGADGNFYGTTTGGGANGFGTVFELDQTGTFSVLHSFDNTVKQEGFAAGPLVQGSDGNLYGSTTAGSLSGQGAVYKLAPDGVFTILQKFGTSANGKSPSTILQSGPRTFYGTAGGSLITNGPSGVYKLVVPVHDDVTGAGRASLLASGSGAFSTALISTTGASQGASMAIAAGYYPVAIGDFNGDGVADIVWTSAHDDLYIWFGGASGYTPKYAGTYPAGWSVVGAGDIDGDGKDDLLWVDNQAHEFAYWLMDGSTRTGSRIFNITPGYYPAAIGDFDGDGKSDVLWTSANNDLYMWLSTGSGFTSKYVTTYPAGWKIVGRGDLDGDGRDDLVWQTKDGANWGYWLMNGASIEKTVTLSVPVEVVGYTIAGTSDYNGDGVADVVWSNGSNLVLWSNLGQCSITVVCTFNTSTSPISVPAGEAILNSGVPLSVTMQ